VADANMDRAPLVAIAGQAATTRMHKESHQVLDLAALFRHFTKFSAQVLEPEIVPEVVRKAFKLAQAEKPGASFIEVPENIARMAAEGLAPLKVQAAATPLASQAKVEQIARLIDEAKAPLVLVGNGVIRQGASGAVVAFIERLNLPAATTFMAKGAVPFSHPRSLGTIGLQARDPAAFGLERADLVLCIGYDMVEYDPARWNPQRDKRIVHIDSAPAEVDGHYVLAAGIVGDIADAVERIGNRAAPRTERTSRVHAAPEDADDAYPLKPQRVIADLRRAMAHDDVLVSDVGAHKLWIARLFQAERPNTCIISNGFAAMGIALPGAIAAKLALPERRVVAVSGDGGFLMNSQELETAVRLGVAITVLVLRDGKYGVIQHHMDTRLGRHFGVDFGNPDLVAYAESFGLRGYRIERADDLLPALRSSLEGSAPSLIDCPIDYRENEKLSQALGEVICQG
jgi:acetolactate synthase I/II/III large subunit